MSPDYCIREGLECIDFERVHRWLTESYWSPGIAREKVERAARGSALVLSVHHTQAGQVGYTRVISDKATFAWLADVYVDSAHRSRGLGRAMVGNALMHPEFQGLRRWLLATKDAHGVYAGVGFHPVPYPERLMAHIPK